MFQMKTLKNIYQWTAALCLIFFTAACSDFEDINKNPADAGIEQVKAEYFLNLSIIEAQQDPHIGERMFVLTWKRAARFEWGNGITIGNDNNEWISDYFSTSYGVKWLNAANQAINVGNEQIEKGIAAAYTNNVIQIARIWRAYLNAEFACGFGPIPAIDAFNGVNPDYDNEKDVFYYILQELKEAGAALDPAVDMSGMSTSDAFFAGNVNAWKKYANSLRMRYAMLLSKVDNTKAKSEFEDAAKGGESTLITTAGDIAQVAEKDGWNALAGVMSRSWDAQPITATFNNLAVGLGGQTFEVPDSLEPYLKDPHSYLGLYVDKHFPLTTNDPCAGYFFDGIPEIIDPRATKLFNIPGFKDGTIYFDDGSGLASTANLMDPDNSSNVLITIPTKFSWSAWVAGQWDVKGGLSSDLTSNNRNYPRISNVYRTSTNKRVWFGSWETYFLLAEAAYYGWNTGGTAKDFYEKGVKASFAYLGLDNADAYLASTDYNRIGTSVNFDHITEAQPFTINYVDAYTEAAGTVQYTYPVNSIYNGGATNNDALTKIITQKYLSFVPWNPLEAWNDQRRLGLPFMENQAVEQDYTSLQVPLTTATSKECRLEFYPKRYRYPATLESTNEAGYKQALQELGGADKSTSPLWWNMK